MPPQCSPNPAQPLRRRLVQMNWRSSSAWSGRQRCAASARSERVLGEHSSGGPLNVLGLHNPPPRSILPNFLLVDDCQLLSRIRDTISKGPMAKRCSVAITEWNRWWRDDDYWALLAQGGAQTLPHQNSCGKVTWLPVQEGRVGFGWILRPSRKSKCAARAPVQTGLREER